MRQDDAKRSIQLLVDNYSTDSEVSWLKVINKESVEAKLKLYDKIAAEELASYK